MPLRALREPGTGGLRRAGGRATAVCFGMLLSSRVIGKPEPGEPVAVLGCEQRPSKGRILCEAEVEVRQGRLAWADLIVIEAPDFASPLRSRIGFLDAVMRSEQRVRLPLAVLAAREGDGRIAVRLRAVVCEGDGDEELCVPRVTEATTTLRVGPVSAR